MVRPSTSLLSTTAWLLRNVPDVKTLIVKGPRGTSKTESPEVVDGELPEGPRTIAPMATTTSVAPTSGSHHRRRLAAEGVVDRESGLVMVFEFNPETAVIDLQDSHVALELQFGDPIVDQCRGEPVLGIHEVVVGLEQIADLCLTGVQE